MGLSEFIQENKEAIINDWVCFAREHIPPAQHMDLAGLRDHISGILKFVVNDLDSAQTKREQREKSEGEGVKAGGAGDSMAETHADVRFMDGFNSVEILSEFRALRASVIRLWERERTKTDGDYLEVIRFNEAIDQIFFEGLSRYNERIGSSRDLFLGIIVHDLRNPLSAVSQSAELLNRLGNLDEKQKMLVGQISTSTIRITKLVTDLIDVVRARLGKGIPIDTKPMDMRTVVEQAVNEAKAAHPDRNIFVEATGDLRGDGDSLRMAQVLSNLIGNAIQHGGKTSAIRVIAKGTPQEIQLSVHNEGAVIPTAVIATIFDPMTRGKGKKQEESASMSLGLGLFIAKEVVEAHGGEINVLSNEAQGTTFSARFPRFLSEEDKALEEGCPAAVRPLLTPDHQNIADASHH
jgi:signal transduction histidine kinase